MLRSHVMALMALSLSLVISGCSTTINLSDFAEDTTTDMEKAERMPTKEAVERSRSRARVILLAVDNAEGGRANREMNEAFSRAVEAELVKKGVEVVDRSLADRLDQEIKACEMQGRSKCSSNVQPSVAQFAVKPSVTNASYSSVAVSEQRATGGDALALSLMGSYGGEFVQRFAVDGTNDVFVVKPHMLHNARVSTTVKVYEIPSLRELKGVVGSGKQEQRTANAAAQVQGAMMVGALNAAVPTAADMAELANVFAPKGYVIGRRSSPKASIFRVSVGTGQGVRQEMKVMIATERENENPITGQKTIDLVDVVHGRVSSVITEDEAWVVPDDEEKAKKVSLGDRVIIKHEANALEKFASGMKKFSQ